MLLTRGSSRTTLRFGRARIDTTSLLTALRPESLGVGRAGAGAVMVLRPTALTDLMGVTAETGGQVSWAVQMLGAREVAIGVGSVLGLRSGEHRAARTWLAAGLLCDLVDAVALTAAMRAGRVKTLPAVTVITVAASAVAIQGIALAGRARG